MAYRVCSTPGCPALTDKGGKCERHRKAARKASDAKRPPPRERGYDREHERDRKDYFAVFPYCVEIGCGELATDLDHIDGNPQNRDWRNYRGYCGTHHAQRTARDQPGGWNAR